MKSYETQLPVPKPQELDSACACAGATASASAAANAAAASATANAAAATAHTYSRTFSSVHVVCTWYARGMHVVCTAAAFQRPAASLQRAYSEELTLVSKTWLPSRSQGPSGVRNICHEVLRNPRISSEFPRNHNKKSAEINRNPLNSREIDRIHKKSSDFLRIPEKFIRNLESCREIRRNLRNPEKSS